MKIIISLVSLMLIVTTHFAQANLINVARYASVSASHSNASGTNPSRLVDGNRGTHSQIYGNYSAWWKFDLGQLYTVEGANYIGAWKNRNYSWVDYRFSSYNILARETTSDPWETVVSVTGNSSPTNYHTFAPVTAQYWLFQVVRSNYVHPNWHEFELMGNLPQVDIPPSIALMLIGLLGLVVSFKQRHKI